MPCFLLAPLSATIWIQFQIVLCINYNFCNRISYFLISFTANTFTIQYHICSLLQYIVKCFCFHTFQSYTRTRSCKLSIHQFIILLNQNEYQGSFRKEIKIDLELPFAQIRFQRCTVCVCVICGSMVGNHLFYKWMLHENLLQLSINTECVDRVFFSSPSSSYDDRVKFSIWVYVSWFYVYRTNSYVTYIYI